MHFVYPSIVKSFALFSVFAIIIVVVSSSTARILTCKMLTTCLFLPRQPREAS
jgi:hypothetical protein